MKKLWKEIKRLRAVNAKHRSGFRLGEVDGPFILEQAQKELFELMQSPHDGSELADLLGVLYHYAQYRGWGRKDIQRIALKKLGVRFTEPPS